MSQEEVMISYYRDGYLHELKGRVIKINQPYRYIVFEYLKVRELKISFDMIINIAH
ncbi:MAG: YolD-like family protein [Turicibacter sp.]